MTNTNGIQCKANIMGGFVISLNNGETKSMVIKRGDYVPNLVYYDDGELKTISGRVKYIHVNFNNTKKRLLPRMDYNKPDKDFSEMVTLKSLVIDCSSKNKSDLRTIPVENIRDFTPIMSDDLEIYDILLVGNNVISFKSNIEPVVLIWNDEVVIPEKYDNCTNRYWGEIETMNKVNSFVVHSKNDISVADAVDGIEPTQLMELEFNDELNTVMDSFIEAMTTEHEENYTLPDDSYYVKIADNVGKVDNISINRTLSSEDGCSFKSSSVITNKDMFKWDEDTRELFVSAPLMYIPNKYISDIKRNVYLLPNDFSLDINVPNTETKLALGEITLVDNGDDTRHAYTNNNGIIEETREVLSSMIKVKITKQDGSQLPENTPVLIRKHFIIDGDKETDYSDWGNFIITKTDDLEVILTPFVDESYSVADKDLTYRCLTQVFVYKVGMITIDSICNNIKPVRKTEYTVGGTNPDFDTLDDALHSLQDGDTLYVNDGEYTGIDGYDIPVLTGIYIHGRGENVLFNSPLNITATSGTVHISNIKFRGLTSVKGTSTDPVGSYGYVLNATNGCNVVVTECEFIGNKFFFDICRFKNTGYVYIEKCFFELNKCCFGITFGDKYRITQKSIIVKQCIFDPVDCKPIVFGEFNDGIDIRVEECIFNRSEDMPPLPPHVHVHHVCHNHKQDCLPNKVIHPTSGPICADRFDIDSPIVPYFCLPPHHKHCHQIFPDSFVVDCPCNDGQTGDSDDTNSSTGGNTSGGQTSDSDDTPNTNPGTGDTSGGQTSDSDDTNSSTGNNTSGGQTSDSDDTPNTNPGTGDTSGEQSSNENSGDESSSGSNVEDPEHTDETDGGEENSTGEPVEPPTPNSENDTDVTEPGPTNPTDNESSDITE